MDPRENPYTPNAGARPPVLVGRSDQLATFEVLLARLARGRSEQSMIITGLRGVGKTVLLAEFREYGRGRGLGRRRRRNHSPIRIRTPAGPASSQGTPSDCAEGPLEGPCAACRRRPQVIHADLSPLTALCLPA